MANYNFKTQKSFRKELRNQATGSDKLLWTSLKQRQAVGFKFRRQQGVGRYVVDFYCPELKLAIEIDGPSHSSRRQKLLDAKRQLFIESHEIRFLRFTDDEVREDVNKVVRRICEWIERNA